MNRRICLALLLSMAMGVTSGCRDRVEIGQLGIVSLLGIDQAEEPGMFDITAQMIRPSEVGSTRSSSGSQPFLVISTTGTSVFDAIRKATTISSRKLFFSHDRVVVIGNELARSGIYPVLDLLFRDEEFRPNLNLLVATGKAKDIIYSVSEFESIPGIGLSEMLRASAATSAIGESTLHEFRLALASSPGLQPVASLVDSVATAVIGDDRSFVGSKVSPGSDVEERVLRLVGTAIFRDDRMVGTLDLVESRGYRWVIGKVDSGIVNVQIPGNGNKVDLEIVAAKNEIKITMVDDQPKIEVHVRSSAEVGAQEGNEDLTSVENLQLMETLYSNAVEQEITVALRKAQQQQTDIFGFGDKLRSKEPKAWQQLRASWPETFAGLQIKVSLKAHVDRYGLISTPNLPRE